MPPSSHYLLQQAWTVGAWKATLAFLLQLADVGARRKVFQAIT